MRLKHKANSKFNMPAIRRRAKLAVKKRYKKTISLSTVDKVWKDYVEHAIIKKVLYRSEANIEGHFKVELVGKPYSPKLLKMLESGWNVGKFSIIPAQKWSRLGYIYGLRFIDSKYKGQIVFQADKDFKKRVHIALRDTPQYYKIER